MKAQKATQQDGMAITNEATISFTLCHKRLKVAPKHSLFYGVLGHGFLLLCTLWLNIDVLYASTENKDENLATVSNEAQQRDMLFNLLRQKIKHSLYLAPDFDEEELKSYLRKKFGISEEDELWDILDEAKDEESEAQLIKLIKRYVEIKTNLDFPYRDRIIISNQAEDKFPLYDMGDEISVRCRYSGTIKTLKGRFLGKKGVYIYLDNNIRIYQPDILDDTLNHVDPLRNECLRKDYVNINFDLPRSMYSEQLYGNLASKYLGTKTKFQDMLKELVAQQKKYQEDMRTLCTLQGLREIILSADDDENIADDKLARINIELISFLMSPERHPSQETVKNKKQTSAPLEEEKIEIPSDIADYKLWELVFNENRRELLGMEFTISGMLSGAVHRKLPSGEDLETLSLLERQIIVEPNSESIETAEKISEFYRKSRKNAQNKPSRYKDWLLKARVSGTVDLADKPSTLLIQNARIIAWYGVDIQGNSDGLHFTRSQGEGTFIVTSTTQQKKTEIVEGEVIKSGKAIDTRALKLAPEQLCIMGWDPLSLLTEVHQINKRIKHKRLGALRLSVKGSPSKSAYLHSIDQAYESCEILNWVPPNNVHLYKIIQK